MGAIKTFMLALLGFLIVTTIDAWTLSIDILAAPFATKFMYSALKYGCGVAAPLLIWVIIARKSRSDN